MKDKIGKYASIAANYVSDYRTYVPAFSGAALSFFLLVLIVPATTIIALTASIFNVDLSILTTVLQEYLGEFASIVTSVLENASFSFSSVVILAISIYAISRAVGMIYQISKRMFPTDKYNNENIIFYYVYVISVTVVLLAMFSTMIVVIGLGPIARVFNIFYGYIVFRVVLFAIIAFFFFFVLYKIIPRTTIYAEDIARGALFTTIGLGGFYIFVMIYFHFANFSNVYGPLASLILILFVFNWGSEIFYIGMYVIHLRVLMRSEKRTQVVTIRDITARGVGITRVFGKRCMVPNAFPGEEVEIHVDKDRGRVLKAHVTRVLTRSEKRTHAECGQAEKCNGCSLQFMKYYDQIEFKQRLVKESIAKNTNFRYDDDVVMPVMPANDILGYQQYAAFPIFGYFDKVYIGIPDKKGDNHIYKSNCPLQDRMINRVMTQIEFIFNYYDCHAYDRKTKNGLRYLIVKKIEEDIHVIIVTGADGVPEKALKEIGDIDEIDGLFISINTARNPLNYEDKIQKIYGEDYLRYHYQGDEYILSAGSYVFISPEMEDNTIQLLKDMLNPEDRVLSAYCKSGILEMQLLNEKIVAIDDLKCNIEDAANNAKRLGKDNIQFICKNVEGEIVNQLQHGNFDSIILHLRDRIITMGTLQALFQSESIKNIYFISDDPSIFMQSMKSADFSLKRLDAFILEIVWCVDKEPYTSRVETLFHFYKA
ncbi:MAG: YihY/virulence factor BrkB family protein [Erysipelotrichaceae bacterium]|nr:YihY/virulence factor BrkB family protein [Erysipelotrichaceae bacterium]